jgi:transposase
LKALAANRDDWLLVDQDESWFSRFAQPAMHGWAECGNELRLVERQAKKGEPHKAIACYGAREPVSQQRYLFFAEGQPDTTTTIEFLERLLAVAAHKAKRVLAIIWDRASWHKSHELGAWIRQHNRKAKRQGGVRLLTCLLPSKSPWLNPVEPLWLHAKRKVSSPDQALSVDELKARIQPLFDVNLNSIEFTPSDRL